MGYIAGVLGRTWWQLFQLFAVPFALAMVLQWVGDKIRRKGVNGFGEAYWYVVAPGIACHEAGHAAGCLITGTKIYKFVPFTRKSRDMLGYVQHESRQGFWGGIADFIIATGPVWFGCLVVVLLTKVFGGVSYVARYGDFFNTHSVPGFMEYMLGVASAASSFGLSLFSKSIWGWGFAVWLYLVFCIASEIGLSSIDLKSMRRGIVPIVVAFLLLNLIPLFGNCVSAGIFIIVPWLFKLHVLMFSAMVFNLILLAVIRVLSRMLT